PPDNFTFYLRGTLPSIESSKLGWFPMILTNRELLDNARFHSDPSVDVGLVDITERMIQKYTEKGVLHMGWGDLNKSNLIGTGFIKAEITDDVVVIGYPKGFHDTKNLYPIAKTGMIATSLGTDFNYK